jgi:hypothetical protein
MAKIKMMKGDAQISITFGTPFVQRLQTLLISLTEGRSEEELTTFQTLIQNQQELTEPWMENLKTLITLVREIEVTAEKSGFMIESDTESI